MKGLLIAVMSIGTALSMSQAFAQGWQQRGDGYISRPIYQSFQGRNVLRVRSLLGIGRQYDGNQVQFVTLRARTAAGRGQATLLVNGNPVGYSQTVGVYTQDYIFRLPPYANRLGRDIQTLQVELRGNFAVDELGVQLRGSYNPAPPPPPPQYGYWECRFTCGSKDFQEPKVGHGRTRAEAMNDAQSQTCTQYEGGHPKYFRGCRQIN